MYFTKINYCNKSKVFLKLLILISFLFVPISDADASITNTSMQLHKHEMHMDIGLQYSHSSPVPIESIPTTSTNVEHKNHDGMCESDCCDEFSVQLLTKFIACTAVQNLYQIGSPLLCGGTEPPVPPV